MPVDSAQLGGLATGRLSSSGPLPYLDAEDAIVSLHVIRGGQILPLPGSGDFIIGRVSEGQSILPDIDLEPFEGFEAGVSRLHVQLHIGDDGINIMDLGSSNGTQLNNNPLLPQKKHPLKHKDLIRLGRLSLQVLVNEQ